MKKKIVVLLMIAAIGLQLSGCCMSHEWSEATCIQPKTCVKCHKTEGDVSNNHSWKMIEQEDATIFHEGYEKKKCELCGAVRESTMPVCNEFGRSVIENAGLYAISSDILEMEYKGYTNVISDLERSPHVTFAVVDLEDGNYLIHYAVRCAVFKLGSLRSGLCLVEDSNEYTELRRYVFTIDKKHGGIESYMDLDNAACDEIIDYDEYKKLVRSLPDDLQEKINHALVIVGIEKSE